MLSHAAPRGVFPSLLLAILLGPPAGAAVAAPTDIAPSAGGSGMRHGVLSAAVARRDSLPAPPVDSLIARAMAGSPDLAAVEARIEGARRAAERTGGLMRLEVGAVYERMQIPIPVMADPDGGHDSHGGEEFVHTTMNMVGPDVELELPFPGGGRARRQAREGVLRSRSAELEAMRRTLRREIRERYADIYAVDRELAAHRLVREMLAAIEESRRARVAAGGSTRDALAASLAVVRLDERCDDLEIERAALDAALRRLVGDPAMPELPTIRELAELPVDLTALETSAVAGSAELVLRRERLRAAELEIGAARAMLRPTLMVGAGWMFGADRSSSGNVRVGVSLPGLAGLDAAPPVEEARGEAAALRAELAAADIATRSDARRLQAAWAWNEEQRRRYDREIRPLSLTTFESARASLLDGRGELGDVLESLTMWIEAEAGGARREAERFRLAALIDAMVRPVLPPSDSSRLNGGSR